MKCVYYFIKLYKLTTITKLCKNLFANASKNVSRNVPLLHVAMSTVHKGMSSWDNLCNN